MSKAESEHEEGYMSTEGVPSLEDLIGQKQRVTGTEIPEGSYPGTLFGYSAPFWLKTSEKFLKPGQPEKRLMIRAEFGLRLKDGKVDAAGMMFQVPQGEIHRKSNSYKFVKALASGDAELMNADGDVSASFTLKKLIGKNATVSVKNNDKGFPQVEGLLPPMEGAKYPTLEECAPLVEGSKGIPF